MSNLNKIKEEVPANSNEIRSKLADSKDYAVRVKLLDRFYTIYEKDRKTGSPQNFIDYFKASHFLITEVDKAYELGKQETLAMVVEVLEENWNPKNGGGVDITNFKQILKEKLQAK